MTTVLALLVTACVIWVGATLWLRRGTGDPSQTVEGFSRALHAIAPEEEAGRPRRRRSRRERG